MKNGRSVRKNTNGTDQTKERINPHWMFSAPLFLCGEYLRSRNLP